MKKIIVVGANGKMGSAVIEKLKKDFEIIKITRNDNIFEVKNADLIIDFGSAVSSVISAKVAVLKKIPLIVGSTGQTTEQKEFIFSCANEIPVMVQPNFSIGICMIKRLIQIVLSQKIDDIAVFEKHHAQKKDFPSGTANELAKSIQENFAGNVQILSERGGREVGTHTIDFYFGDEKISISHTAFSREVFALGAKEAVEFLIDKPRGIYNFEETFKF